MANVMKRNLATVVEPLKDDTPLFLLVTYQTVLPLITSEESVDELTRHVERSGYDFTVMVETITAADVRRRDRKP